MRTRRWMALLASGLVGSTVMIGCGKTAQIRGLVTLYEFATSLAYELVVDALIGTPS